MRATSSRLPVTNRAREAIETGWRAMQSAMSTHSSRYTPIGLCGTTAGRSPATRSRTTSPLRRAADRDVLPTTATSSGARWRCAASRCTGLDVRWSNDAGYVTAYLHLCEVGEDGRIIYDARFDEDDFDGAYRELDRRYYAGEGAAFAGRCGGDRIHDRLQPARFRPDLRAHARRTCDWRTGRARPFPIARWRSSGQAPRS